MKYQVNHVFKWSNAEGLKIDKQGNVVSMRLNDISLIAKQTDRKEKEKITIDNISYNPIEWFNRNDTGLNVIINQKNSTPLNK